MRVCAQTDRKYSGSLSFITISNLVAAPYLEKLTLQNLARSAPRGCEVKWPNQVRVTVNGAVQAEMADLYGSEAYRLPEAIFKALAKGDFEVVPVFAAISTRSIGDHCTLLSLRIRS